MHETAKIAALVALAVVLDGCSTAKLHVDVIDMNDIESSVVEDARPKTAAQVRFQLDF